MEKVEKHCPRNPVMQDTLAHPQCTLINMPEREPKSSAGAFAPGLPDAKWGVNGRSRHSVKGA